MWVDCSGVETVGVGMGECGRDDYGIVETMAEVQGDFLPNTFYFRLNRQ